MSELTIFYRPRLSRVEPDGTLSVSASWYEDGSHNSGRMVIPVADADYKFWFWVISTHGDWGPLNAEDVNNLRLEFAILNEE